MKLTPKEAALDLCQNCVGSRMMKEIKDCTGYKATGGPCPLYQNRLGGRRLSVKIFRKFCLECMGNSSLLVSECEMEKCPAHVYRFGTNPSMEGRLEGRNMGRESRFKKAEGVKTEMAGEGGRQEETRPEKVKKPGPRSLSQDS
jgi:hypothetical protein